MVGDEEEKGDEEADERDDEPFHGLCLDRPLGKHFEDRKADVSAVEDWNGEEVYEAQIEADYRHPEERLFGSHHPALMDNVDDSDRAADVFWAERSRK